ncbi:hypothetical protein GALMADRAFT_783974 [Galerina marginata CBS 339.88]|uniref:MYND-type domain-containing protein n=1 Tax=Galerina marginata (strain CBS 339.88) TaxID=685588 RepID=A0A067SPD3_GALM3|nr:hypothetical protein GALMADRAFT_783974 [Galerina marginata CBS 339.88]
MACIQTQKSAPDLLSLLNTACCAAVIYLCPGDGMVDLMADTPGFLALLAKIWAVECDAPPITNHEVTADFLPASLALFSFTDTSKPKWFDAVHDALGKDPKETGRITLETLRKRAEQLELVFGALIADLHILHVNLHWNLSGTDTPFGLRDHLFSLEGRQIVKSVMERLLAYRGENTRQASICLAFCIKYFMISLQKESGRAWAYRMYDAPILEAIIQASIWPTDEDAYLALALNEITPYILFRSVLYRAEKAVDTVADLGLEAQMDKDGPVYQILQRYKKLLNARLEVADGRSIGTKVCENAKCGRIAKSNQLLRCGGCKKVHYCNKECQKQSWREGGHRTMCGMLKEGPAGIEFDNEPGEYRLTPEDYKFFRKLVHIDVNRFSSDFLKLKAKLGLSKPDTKMSIVAFVLDYSQGSEVQIRLEPDPLGTALAWWGSENGTRVESVAAMVKRVEQDGPSFGTIVRAILPFGMKPLPVTLMIRLNEAKLHCHFSSAFS